MTYPASPATVSVVIPAFNNAKTVAQTLESVFAQSFPRIETIVVNDGSTDETRDVLETFGSQITLINQTNRGVGHARNVGCEAAHGQFIAMLDADDLCLPDRIAIQVAAMQQFPEVVLCSTGFSAFDESGPISDSYGDRYYSRVRGAPRGLASLYPEAGDMELSFETRSGGESIRIGYYAGNVYRELAFGNFVHPPTVLFRRETLQRSGRFDESLRYNHDWEWIVRMSRLGSLLYLRMALLDYRISPNQLSSGVRNRGRGTSEAVAVARKIWESDPELEADDDGRLREFRAQLYGDAADSLSESSKVEAMRMLAAAVAQGADRGHSARIAARILMPRALLGAIRRRRRPHGSS